MKTVIYYFSGTGNSLRTARLLAKALGGARLVSMAGDPAAYPAEDAERIGIVCPVYEWDVPRRVRTFLAGLRLNPAAYCFQVATYIAVHGRCFETVDAILRQKGARLDYGRALRCVASQCIAYEPFPPPRWMVPRSERQAARIGRELAEGRRRPFPKMSPLTRFFYPKMMTPFLNVRHTYDEGFFVTGICAGCRLCQRVCPCGNITFEGARPVWNHRCEGCNACVVYCPSKAIQFRTPEAYLRLDNPISRRLGLPEDRTRYHHPKITAADLMRREEEI